MITKPSKLASLRQLIGGVLFLLNGAIVLTTALQATGLVNLPNWWRWVTYIGGVEILIISLLCLAIGITDIVLAMTPESEKGKK